MLMTVWMTVVAVRWGVRLLHRCYRTMTVRILAGALGFLTALQFAGKARSAACRMRANKGPEAAWQPSECGGRPQAAATKLQRCLHCALRAV